MFRPNQFSVTLDTSKLTKTELAFILNALISGDAELSYNGDGTVWIREKLHDDFLALAKEGKAKIKSNMPKRYIKDDKGPIETKDGRYRIATPEDIKKEFVKEVEYAAGGFEENGGRRKIGNRADI